MTILTTGAYDFPAAADRNRNSMTLQQIGNNPLTVMDGVHAGLSLTKTTGMGFQIGPGRAAVNGATAADGTFTTTFTAPEIGVFDDNATGTDRYDLVVLQSYPNNPSTTGIQVVVVKGVALASAYVAGAGGVPAGCLPLYRVKIGAGVSAANGGWNTSQVMDLRRTIGIPEFIDYTPTFGGWGDLGQGSVFEGKYRVDGDKVTVYARYVAGAGASMHATNALYFTLPIPAKSGWVYNGIGTIHHQSVTGLAFDLRVLSNDGVAFLWAPDGNGALIQPGRMNLPYMWETGSHLYASLEYYIDRQ